MDQISQTHFHDPDAAWAAFARRDGAFDGRFVVAVRTTRIYCRPSCPARRPRRENIAFFPDGESACRAGYRPCRRCLPDEVGRDRLAVERARRLIKEAEGGVLRLARVAGAVGMHLGRKVASKALSRWVPLVGAAGVGASAWWDTRQVGRAALQLFEREVVIDNPV